MLVLDGNERASLAIVRSLTAAGWDVVVGARGSRSLGSVSRGARGVVIDVDPLLEPTLFAHTVATECRRLGCALLIPVTDASLEAMLENRALLPASTVLPFPSLDVYRAASDKVLVHRLACDAGIGIEETVVVEAHGDPAPADASLYPGVVKPHRSIVGHDHRYKTSVELVSDRAACASVLRALPPAAFPVLVQRRVRGSGEGFFAARWRGQPIARFAHRRLREKPPSGGVSVFRESIEMDAALVSACEAVLDRLNWEGVAMVEGKRDLDRGGWRVMEINGRFWGSLQLAIDAGVDFPALLASAATGEPIGIAPTWRPGIRLRWEWGDIDHLMLRLLRGRDRLDLPADAPGRLRTLLDVMSHRWSSDHGEVFRWRDPRPFLLESLRRIGLFE